MDTEIRKENRIASGCDQYTSPEEISALSKYLKKKKEELEDSISLGEDRLGIMGFRSNATMKNLESLDVFNGEPIRGISNVGVDKEYETRLLRIQDKLRETNENLTESTEKVQGIVDSDLSLSNHRDDINVKGDPLLSTHLERIDVPEVELDDHLEKIDVPDVKLDKHLERIDVPKDPKLSNYKDTISVKDNTELSNYKDTINVEDNTELSNYKDTIVAKKEEPELSSFREETKGINEDIELKAEKESIINSKVDAEIGDYKEKVTGKVKNDYSLSTELDKVTDNINDSWDGNSLYDAVLGISDEGKNVDIDKLDDNLDKIKNKDKDIDELEKLIEKVSKNSSSNSPELSDYISKVKEELKDIKLSNYLDNITNLEKDTEASLSDLLDSVETSENDEIDDLEFFKDRIEGEVENPNLGDYLDKVSQNTGQDISNLPNNIERVTEDSNENSSNIEIKTKLYQDQQRVTEDSNENSSNIEIKTELYQDQQKVTEDSNENSSNIEIRTDLYQDQQKITEDSNENSSNIEIKTELYQDQQKITKDSNENSSNIEIRTNLYQDQQRVTEDSNENSSNIEIRTDLYQDHQRVTEDSNENSSNIEIKTELYQDHQRVTEDSNENSSNIEIRTDLYQDQQRVTEDSNENSSNIEIRTDLYQDQQKITEDSNENSSNIEIKTDLYQNQQHINGYSEKEYELSKYKDDIDVPDDPDLSKYKDNIDVPDDPDLSKYKDDIDVPDDPDLSKYKDDIDVPDDPDLSTYLDKRHQFIHKEDNIDVEPLTIEELKEISINKKADDRFSNKTEINIETIDQKDFNEEWIERDLHNKKERSDHEGDPIGDIELREQEEFNREQTERSISDTKKVYPDSVTSVDSDGKVNFNNNNLSVNQLKEIINKKNEEDYNKWNERKPFIEKEGESRGNTGLNIESIEEVEELRKVLEAREKDNTTYYNKVLNYIYAKYEGINKIPYLNVRDQIATLMSKYLSGDNTTKEDLLEFERALYSVVLKSNRYSAALKPVNHTGGAKWHRTTMKEKQEIELGGSPEKRAKYRYSASSLITDAISSATTLTMASRAIRSAAEEISDSFIGTGIQEAGDWTKRNLGIDMRLNKQRVLDETLMILVRLRDFAEKKLKISRSTLKGVGGNALSIIGGITKTKNSSLMNMGESLTSALKTNANNVPKEETEYFDPIDYRTSSSLHAGNINYGEIQTGSVVLRDQKDNNYYFYDNYIYSEGMYTTLMDLCNLDLTTNAGRKKVSTVEGLREALERSPFTTTPRKFAKGALPYTLDSNSFWEIILEPFCGYENGFLSYLPCIDEINTINALKFGVMTKYNMWIPITSFDLNTTRLNTKSVGMYEGEVIMPIGLEFTNELRLTVVDDQYKSWRRYFERCVEASIYNSEPHGPEYYEPHPPGETKEITPIDRTYICPALYKNVCFRCRIYSMTPQKQTINQFDLLVTFREFTMERYGEADFGGGSDLNLSFAIVGENPSNAAETHKTPTIIDTKSGLSSTDSTTQNYIKTVTVGKNENKVIGGEEIVKSGSSSGAQKGPVAFSVEVAKDINEKLNNRNVPLTQQIVRDYVSSLYPDILDQDKIFDLSRWAQKSLQNNN